ncbi:hypothetical protein OH686_21105 [Pseudomonas sp. SO81]|nr:hypothetical protein OH686_21105 [Pseudomonas sp. SO81]
MVLPAAHEQIYFGRFHAQRGNAANEALRFQLPNHANR